MVFKNQKAFPSKFSTDAAKRRRRRECLPHQHVWINEQLRIHTLVWASIVNGCEIVAVGLEAPRATDGEACVAVSVHPFACPGWKVFALFLWVFIKTVWSVNRSLVGPLSANTCSPTTVCGVVSWRDLVAAGRKGGQTRHTYTHTYTYTYANFIDVITPRQLQTQRHVWKWKSSWCPLVLVASRTVLHRTLNLRRKTLTVLTTL